MALIRLWGKSGVLRLPKNEHKEEFFKAPSISCSISFPVTPLLLENDVSKDMVCLMWNSVERWDVNYIYELSMVASFSLAIEKIPHKQQIVHTCFFFS